MSKKWQPKLIRYYLEYSDYWPHFYFSTDNISADLFISLLDVFQIKIGSQHRFSNWTRQNLNIINQMSVVMDYAQLVSARFNRYSQNLETI